jgi:hypothetical protein
MAANNYQADLRSGLHGVQEGAETAFNSATLDEKTAHGECPADVGGAMMFKMKCGVGAVSSNASRVFRKEGAYDRYDMKDPSQGMDHTVPDGGQYEGTDFTMPEEHPDLERWAPLCSALCAPSSAGHRSGRSTSTCSRSVPAAA